MVDVLRRVQGQIVEAVYSFSDVEKDNIKNGDMIPIDKF